MTSIMEPNKMSLVGILVHAFSNESTATKFPDEPLFSFSQVWRTCTDVTNGFLVNQLFERGVPPSSSAISCAISIANRLHQVTRPFLLFSGISSPGSIFSVPVFEREARVKFT